MPADSESDLKLEIGHVLLIDIVCYSKLLITEQRERLQALNEIVRNTAQFRASDANSMLVRIPTGDGMALIFRDTVEAPLRCAVEISEAIKTHPEIHLRMGIHSGPVSEVRDVNERTNVAGAGIDIAQRVMDCGDARHILLSKHVAEDLAPHPRWNRYLHDLGECDVKHGSKVFLVNFYTDEVGNQRLPEKLDRAQQEGAAKATARLPAPTFRRKHLLIAAAVLFIAAIGTGLWIYFQQATVTPLLPGKSIAVLPFENLSRDPDNAYFADGIHDEILTRLSKVGALKVISRTSTQKYKSAPDNVREVGKQLGVANLLEGSVQKIANVVHINVQLIRAGTDEHIWAESYDRKLDDVFGVEGEVASAIADQLNAKLSGAEEKAVTDKPTQNTAAYDAYLRAVSLEEGGSGDAAPRAAENYLTAVRLDPKFALAWARLAMIRSFLYFNGENLTVNSAAAVKEAADQALALQPQLAEAFVAQGVYRYRVLRDFQAALQFYAEALKRLPNSSLVLEQMAHVERRLGEWDAAEKHYRAAAELDPRNPEILLSVADLARNLRRFDEANAILDRVLQLSPGNEDALSAKAIVFQTEGRLKDAAEVLGKAAPNSQHEFLAVARMLQLDYERRFTEAVDWITSSAPRDVANDPRTVTTLGYLQEWAGQKEEAHTTFARAIVAMKPSPDSVVPVDARVLPCFLALAYAGLGDKEKALAQGQEALVDYKDDALEKPFAEEVIAWTQTHLGDSDSAIAALPHLLEVPSGLTRANLRINPFWDPLRNDPRFQKLCEEKKP